MLRQYAPVPGTARRSPGCTSAGRNSSFTTTSPASQCFPTTRARIGVASLRLPASVAASEASPLGQLSRRARVVLAGVRDAEAAAEVEFSQFCSVRVADGRLQRQDAAGGDLERVGVEDLGADVRVESGQVERVLLQDPVDRGPGGAAGERETELLVLVRGGDVLVRVRLDPDGDPDHDARPRSRLPGDPAEPVDLL